MVVLEWVLSFGAITVVTTYCVTEAQKARRDPRGGAGFLPRPAGEGVQSARVPAAGSREGPAREAREALEALEALGSKA